MQAYIMIVSLWNCTWMLNLNPHSKPSLSSGIYLYRPYTSSNHRLESAGLNALILGDPGATSRDDAIIVGESLCTSQIEASSGSLRINDFCKTAPLGHLMVPRRRPAVFWIYDSQ